MTKWTGHVSWVPLTSAFFHQRLATSVISKNTDIYYILINNFQNFSMNALEIVLINMIGCLKVSVKLATLHLLKIELFWNKGYKAIVFVDDVTNKILSLESNYFLDVVIWPKFGNSSISMREVIITSVLQRFDQKKPIFLRCALGSSSIIWDWH